MNPVFVFIVLVAAFIFWVGMRHLFNIVGEIILDVYNDIQDKFFDNTEK